MRIVKKLHIFILKTFLPLFAMTFFIVLFIVLMQFLWKYIDDLVGKGLSVDVLAELFFYAAVSMVPMALPLAILLASLMTFGNLGEKFELTAMKAAGISLLRVMAPLIVLVSAIAIGAFFFQNEVLPKAQVKMWTLLFSVRQKSPEVEIPEGVFYDQIPGYNLYVEKKDKNTGMLYNTIIYDVTQNGSNSTIIRADSAKLAFTKDMCYLYLHLWKGEQFENLREATSLDQNVPFRRENFDEKEILIPFDANFNRLDEEGMRKQYVGKNIVELRQSIDSVSQRVDSIGDVYSLELSRRPVLGLQPKLEGEKQIPVPYESVQMPKQLPDLDSVLNAMGVQEASQVLSSAASRITSQRQNLEFQAQTMYEDKKSVRRHQIELIKKYTLSVACLIFFFIGAPLGAIIRKGGIGSPLVISILLFLVYYIIDNTGYKMARDGHAVVWFGIWLSSFVLAPLGAYLTVKAMNDSSVFDKDTYIALFRKWLGLRSARNIQYKEVILEELSLEEVDSRMESLSEKTSEMLESIRKSPGYFSYWQHGADMTRLRELADQLDTDVENIRNCRNKKIVNKLTKFPTIRLLWIYNPTRRRWLAWTLMLLLPVGLPIWLTGLKALDNLRGDLRKTLALAQQIRENI